MRPDTARVPLPSAALPVPPAPPKVPRPAPPPVEVTAEAPVPHVSSAPVGFNPANVAARRAHVKVLKGKGLTRRQVPIVVARAESGVEIAETVGRVEKIDAESAVAAVKTEVSLIGLGAKRKRDADAKGSATVAASAAATPIDKVSIAAAAEGVLAKRARRAAVDVAEASKERLLELSDEETEESEAAKIRCAKEEAVRDYCIVQALEKLSTTLSSTSPACVLNAPVKTKYLKLLEEYLRKASLNKLFLHVGELNASVLAKGRVIVMLDPKPEAVTGFKEKELVVVYSSPKLKPEIFVSWPIVVFHSRTIDQSYFHLFALLRAIYCSRPPVLEYLDAIYARLYMNLKNIPSLKDHELDALAQRSSSKIDKVLLALAEEKLMGVSLISQWEAMHPLYVDYEEKGDTIRELQVLDELIRIQLMLSPIGEDQTQEFAHVWQRRGIIYATEKNFAKALSYLKKALEVLKDDEESPVFAMLCFDLARAYQLNNDLKKAAKFAQKAHSIFLKKFGPDDLNTKRASEALVKYKEKGVTPDLEDRSAVSVLSLFSPPEMRSPAAKAARSPAGLAAAGAGAKLSF